MTDNCSLTTDDGWGISEEWGRFCQLSLVPSPPRWSDWHWGNDGRIVRYNLDDREAVEECGDRCYLEQDLESLKEIRQEYLDSALKAKSKSRESELMRGVKDKDRRIAWVEGKLRELEEGETRSPPSPTVSNQSDSDQLLEGMESEPETLLTVRDKNSPSTNPVTVSKQQEPTGGRNTLLTVKEAQESVTVSKNSKRRRERGLGTGRIQWRTFTSSSGKQYQQAWYDWQVHEGGKTKTRTKYIPKRLLPKIREMEAAKSPVAAVLDLLGVR